MDLRSRLAAQRFEVSRAMRTAHHLARHEGQDTEQAIADLAQAVASLALAIDQMLEAYEIEHAEAS